MEPTQKCQKLHLRLAPEVSQCKSIPAGLRVIFSWELRGGAWHCLDWRWPVPPPLSFKTALQETSGWCHRGFVPSLHTSSALAHTAKFTTSSGKASQLCVIRQGSSSQQINLCCCSTQQASGKEKTRTLSVNMLICLSDFKRENYSADLCGKKIIIIIIFSSFHDNTMYSIET